MCKCVLWFKIGSCIIKMTRGDNEHCSDSNVQRKFKQKTGAIQFNPIQTN